MHYNIDILRIIQEDFIMKSTGIVRKIDELGRIVLPKELRRTLGLNDRESVEIYVDQDAIILKKFKSTCVLYGDNEDLLDFKGKSICQKCMDELKK